MSTNDTANSSCRFQSLMDDLDHYNDAFTNAFVPNTTERSAIQQWLDTNFDQEVVDVMKANLPPNSSDVSVMGVGSGDGAHDQIMIGNLLQHFGEVHYTVVEPGNVIEKFKQRVKENKDLKNVQFKWKNMTYDDFCLKETACRMKYNFISLIHSAYYMEDFMNSLAKLVGSLSRGGAVLIIANVDDSDLSTFHRRLWWKSTKYNDQIFEMVRNFADFSKLRLKTFRIPAKINVTSCFDHASKEGSKLLDFLTKIAHFKETAPSHDIEETLNKVTSLATVGDDGNRYFNLDSDVMIIFNIPK